ncbi:MAG: OB-fold domain-containing protein [Chloroflexi bacterium]|nr:OB-fold domain-containing protein [Chloroflexota bacterium]
MTTEYPKPLPEVTEDSRPFWEGCQRHELLLQQCSRCGYRRYASPLCPQCWSPEHQWVKACGRGVVYTWIVVHQRYHRAFEKDLPYNVTIVELEEGPRLMTNLVGIRNEDIRPGLPVEVAWDDMTKELTLPKFAPAR